MCRQVHVSAWGAMPGAFAAGIAAIAVGGSLFMFAALHATFMFPRSQSTAMAAISCLFDGSTVVFAVVRGGSITSDHQCSESIQAERTVLFPAVLVVKTPVTVFAVPFPNSLELMCIPRRSMAATCLHPYVCACSALDEPGHMYRASRLQVGLLSTTLHLTHGPLFAGFAVFSTVFCALLLAAWRLVHHRHPHPDASPREVLVETSAERPDLTLPLLEPRTGSSEQVYHTPAVPFRRRRVQRGA
jgi:hypothetical protein